MVDCRECQHRFRADHVDALPWTHYCPATKGNKFTIPAGEACGHCGARRTLCPDCGKGELTAPREFNLMFKTFMGPVEEEAAVTYLRPETAQAMFVNFDNVAPVDAAASCPSASRRPGARSATRSRRATSSSGRASSSRWRSSTSSTRTTPSRAVPPTSGGTTAGSRTAWRGSDATACAKRTCACASTRRPSWPTTRSARWTSTTSSPSAGAS